MEIENLKNKLEEEVQATMLEIENIKPEICNHLTCENCKNGNKSKEELRQILMENIKVKRDLINSLEEL